jgi:hypothetical protein
LVVIPCQGRIKDTALVTVSAISPVRLDSFNLEHSGCNQAYRLAPHDKGTIQSILQVVISGPPVLVEHLFVGVSAPRSCTRDEGRPLGVGLQELASNRLKLHG